MEMLIVYSSSDTEAKSTALAAKDLVHTNFARHQLPPVYAQLSRDATIKPTPEVKAPENQSDETNTQRPSLDFSEFSHLADPVAGVSEDIGTSLLGPRCWKLDFEDELFRSNVYSRNLHRTRSLSTIASTVTAHTCVVLSHLSLADVSVASVLRLPIVVEALVNGSSYIPVRKSFPEEDGSINPKERPAELTALGSQGCLDQSLGSTNLEQPRPQAIYATPDIPQQLEETPKSFSDIVLRVSKFIPEPFAKALNLDRSSSRIDFIKEILTRSGHGEDAADRAKDHYSLHIMTDLYHVEVGKRASPVELYEQMMVRAASIEMVLRYRVQEAQRLTELSIWSQALKNKQGREPVQFSEHRPTEIYRIVAQGRGRYALTRMMASKSDTVEAWSVEQLPGVRNIKGHLSIRVRDDYIGPHEWDFPLASGVISQADAVRTPSSPT
jgi:hypothetical protein